MDTNVDVDAGGARVEQRTEEAARPPVDSLRWDRATLKPCGDSQERHHPQCPCVTWSWREFTIAAGEWFERWYEFSSWVVDDLVDGRHRRDVKNGRTFEDVLLTLTGNTDPDPTVPDVLTLDVTADGAIDAICEMEEARAGVRLRHLTVAQGLLAEAFWRERFFTRPRRPEMEEDSNSPARRALRTRPEVVDAVAPLLRNLPRTSPLLRGWTFSQRIADLEQFHEDAPAHVWQLAVGLLESGFAGPVDELRDATRALLP